MVKFSSSHFSSDKNSTVGKWAKLNGLFGNVPKVEVSAFPTRNELGRKRVWKKKMMAKVFR